MPAQDLFGRTIGDYGGGFPAEDASISLSVCGGDLAILAQQLRLQYAQRVSRIYELHQQQNIYYVGGRTEGTLELQNIVGPQNLTAAFFQCLGDMCTTPSTAAFSICFSQGCGGTTQTCWNVDFPLLTSINLGITSEQMVVGMGMGIQFGRLTVS